MSELRPTLERFRELAGAPAVVGGTIDQDGTLDLAACGVRRRDRPDDLATTNDACHIGSCGKSITSALFARLVEAGEAAWGTPLPDLFDDLSPIDHGWSGSTIDDLLRCRAGVAPNPPMSQMKAMFETTEPIADQRTEAAQRVLQKAPQQPGKFVYSNLGYIVAGAAIERVAAMSFEDAMRHYVTEPLGMNSFGYGPPPSICGHRPRLQLGPLVLGRGRAVDVGGLEGDNPPLFSPAGRFHLRLEDWSKFLLVFLRDGDGFLAPETIARLTEIPAEDPHAIAMGWGSAGPNGSVAMQGSNTMWSATVFLKNDTTLASMIVANDGRTSVLRKQALAAIGLLK